MKDDRRLQTQQFNITKSKFHRKPIVPPRLANGQIRINRYAGRVRLVEEEGVKTETCLPGWQQAVRIDDSYQLRRASARLRQEFDYLRSRIRRSEIANWKIILSKLRNFVL